MASERIQRRISILLDEADEAFAQRNWDVVQQRAQDTLALDPENQDALTFVAAAERALGKSLLPSNNPTPDSSPTAAPVAPTNEPTSFGNGRYHVQKFLGEGGKKKVYLAHDSTMDREVAFGLIKTEGLDDTSRTRIQREAQAMSRFGSHPQIVTVFDLGQEGDQPYMVTELMGGGDVKGLIENAPDNRLSLDLVISITKDVCRGLEFAHSKDVIHRNLKPGNVWLTQDGTAKIGDFGLAVVLDHSHLTQEGMLVGTVSYMPPEQAMGGEVTLRSDLYSLGAMLYEMVTGRPPFLGDGAVAIIGQHINTPPVAPTWHNTQCPRLLEALILRLLSKDPSERPETASDVLIALEAIDHLATGAEQPGAAVDEAHSLDSLAGGVFVGRQQEMGELKAALEDALSGRGRLVTLVGEPGIGKTRTAQELTTYAGLRGAQVLWGRCYEAEGAPPYWPWVQAIRSYVRERDTERVQSEMGAGAADIAEIVTDVKERLPGLQAPPQLEPEQARSRLFDSITTFLKTASQGQPLVLVLDDLQWADKPSLLLLEFMARDLAESRLLMIGAYRDVELSRQHPLAETLVRLNREGLFRRVLLRGLTQQDVGRFIEVTSGQAPPAGLAQAIHPQTEGNPLFVTEVVRLLVQEGELTAERASTRESWNVRIPEGVREVIGRRLSRLSQRCDETLTIASVIGREFTLEHLMALIEDMPKDQLLELLEEALASRVIEELPQAVGRYQFTHGLVQDTLSQELSVTRQVSLHARIAQVLEEMYGVNAETHAAELAYHFAEAEPVLGAEKLVRYSQLAGEQSLATYAYEGAMAHFQRALSAKEGQSPGTETAALSFGLGRAQAAALGRQQLDVAFASMGRAFEIYVERNDVAGAVAVAEYPIPLLPGHRGGMELVARALQLIPPDSLEAGRLLSRYVLAKGLEEGDYEGAAAAFDSALAISQRNGDAALEMRTLADSSMVDFWHLRWQETVAKGLRVIELARRADDQLSEVSARFWVGIVLLNTGDSIEAQRHAAAMLAMAESLRAHYWLATALWFNERASCSEGEWQAAREFNQRGLLVSPSDTRLLATRMLLEHEVGNVDEGHGYLARLVEALRLVTSGARFDYASVALLIPVVARISGAVDRLHIAEDAAAIVLSAVSATPTVTQHARVGLALMAVLRGDVEAAREQYVSLSPGAGTFSFLSVDRLLGLLAHTMGSPDQAAAHFEDALALCRKANYRPELAWSCCDYADALLQRNGEGDRAKSNALLDESLAISSELGMRPLMERVLSRREILRA